jgi:putative glutathione S-transferase
MAELAPQDREGNYQRPSYRFEGKIGSAQFADEPGRYHLYVGNPCPWCHRTKLAVNLLGFESKQLGVTLLEDDPVKASRGGWVFNDSQPDPLGNGDLRERKSICQTIFLASSSSRLTLVDVRPNLLRSL